MNNQTEKTLTFIKPLAILQPNSPWAIIPAGSTVDVLDDPDPEWTYVPVRITRPDGAILITTDGYFKSWLAKENQTEEYWLGTDEDGEQRFWEDSDFDFAYLRTEDIKMLTAELTDDQRKEIPPLTRAEEIKLCAEYYKNIRDAEIEEMVKNGMDENHIRKTDKELAERVNNRNLADLLDRSKSNSLFMTAENSPAAEQ
jgi:hypothetical protein